MIAAAGLGLSAVATWFLRVVGDRDATPLPRPGRRSSSSRTSRAAGVGGDDRAPRTARLPRPPRPCCATRCSRSTTCTCRCSRPPGGSSGSPSPSILLDGGEPVARAARRVRAPDRAHRVVAARASSARPRKVSRRTIAWPATSSCSARPRPPGKEVRVTGIGPNLVEQRAGGVGRVVRARRAGPLVERVLAHARVGDLRRRVRRGDRVRRVRARRVGRGGAARARGREPAVAVRRRDRRRDRVPPRHLARRVAPPRVARGLRRSRSTSTPISRCRTASTTASGSSTCRSATRAPTARARRRRRSTCRPARSSRSSARTARARRRS